jgi:hypothetical protein
MILHSLLIVLYLVIFRPFETNLGNNLEIVNEMCILLSSYHLLVWTNWCTNDQIQNLAGYSILGVTAINVATNTSVMIAMTAFKVKSVIQKYKKKYRKYKYDQLAKKYTVKVEETKSDFIQ